MKNIKFRTLVSVLATTGLFAELPAAQAARGSAAPTSKAATLKVGTPKAFVDGLSKSNVKAASRFTFLSSSGEPIPAIIETYYFEKGQLSITGRAEESDTSSFIFKGDNRNVYGWLVLQNRNVAYEYTTDPSGDVVVEEVPVEKIYPICNVQHSGGAHGAEARASEATMTGDPPHVGDYPGTDVRKLQSLPGAKKILYLDITGVMNGDTPKDFDKAEMWKSWQAVAAGFSMYAVNVTTDPDVYKAAGVANAGIAKFISTDGRANCSLNAFGTTRSCNVYTTKGAEKEKGYGVGRTALHELGHLVGLSHDGGQPGGEYFNGIPEFKWCPIMGNYYVAGSKGGDDVVYQWSKGEYSGASQKQDDLTIIAKNLEFRTDDVPDSKPLQFSGATDISADMNRGQIASNTDSDAFTFKIVDEKGHATLTVDRIEYLGGAMLDIDASLLDASSKELAKSNDKAIRRAKFDLDLSPGEYKLVIKSGAEGTPVNGFSAYSSLGFYGIQGKIQGGLGTTGGSGGAGGSSGGNAGASGSAGAGGRSTGGTGTGGGATGGTGMGGKSGSGGMSSGGASGSGAGAGTSGQGGAGGNNGKGGISGGGVGGESGKPDEGCGCHVPKASGPSALAVGSLLAAAALGATARRRRRDQEARRIKDAVRLTGRHRSHS